MIRLEKQRLLLSLIFLCAFYLGMISFPNQTALAQAWDDIQKEQKSKEESATPDKKAEDKQEEITKDRWSVSPEGHILPDPYILGEDIFGSRKKPQKQKTQKISLDISGCWKDPKRGNITITQRGNKISVSHSYYKRVFTGTLKGNILTLHYGFKGTADLASVLWTDNTPPDKVLNQVPLSVRHIDFELKVAGENKLTGTFKGLWIDWDKENYKLNFAKSYDTPAEWVRSNKAKIKSLIATDTSFNKKLSEVNRDGSFWIKATASSGCSQAIDKVEVTIYPKDRESDAIKVKLKETTPNSLEFRSVRPIKISELNAKEGDKIFIRSGLRGTSLIVKQVSRPVILNKEQDRIADFLQGFPLKFRYPESDIKGYKFYAVVKAADKETKRIALTGTPQKGKEDSLLLKASSPGHYEVIIEGVGEGKPTLKSKPHKVSFYKIDVKHSISIFEGRKIITSNWPPESIKASNLPAKVKFDFSILPSLQVKDNLFVLHTGEGKSKRVLQLKGKEWKGRYFFGEEEIVKLGDIPFSSLSKDKKWQDYQKMKTEQDKQTGKIKEEYAPQIEQLTNKKEQLAKELFRVGEDIRQRTVFANSDLQSRRDALQETVSRLRSDLLRELRQKNERLMSNPRADTTLYDKEINRLKEDIKLTEKRLRESDKNIKADLKSLKLKKAKLKKAQKAIVDEIRGLNKEMSERIKGRQAQSKTLDDIITKYQNSKRQYSYKHNLVTGLESHCPFYMEFAWGIKSGDRDVLFANKGFSILNKGTGTTIAKRLNKEIISMFERYKKAGLLPKDFDEQQAYEEAKRFSLGYGRMLAKVMDKVNYDLDSGGTADNNLRQNAFFKLIGRQKGLVCEAWQSVVRDWAQGLEAGEVSGASEDSQYKYLRVVPVGTPHNDQGNSHHFNWLVLRDPADSGKDLKDESLNAGVALDPWTGAVRFPSWKKMKEDWPEIHIGYYRHTLRFKTLKIIETMPIPVKGVVEVERDKIIYNNSKVSPK